MLRRRIACFVPSSKFACAFLLTPWGNIVRDLQREIEQSASDIVDRNLDLHVERCKVRPIPAGLISTLNAILAFLAWIPIALGITYMTLGPAATLGFIPVWVLSTIYPFMKRVIPFPQVVLGAIIGGAVFPGWAGVTGEIGMESILKAMPLFAATATWVVYFDVFYATQDRADDAKIGVKSLAVLLGRDVWIFLSALGLLQVVFFAFTAMVANLSLIFWVLGLGVWTLSIPRHIWALDLENRTSGGKIFKANIKLGLYLTGVMLLELASTRVYLGNVKHLLRQGA